MSALTTLFLNDYQPRLKFFIVCVGVFLAVMLTKVNSTSKSILIILAGGAVLWSLEFFVQRVNSSNATVNAETLKKLRALEALYGKELGYFYIDPRMIIFLHSVSTLYKYNAQEFKRLLQGTNSFLRIRTEIQVFTESNSGPVESEPLRPSFKVRSPAAPRRKYLENLPEMYQIATGLKVKCVNNLHNFVYSVPYTKETADYLGDVIKNYIKLCNANLDVVKIYHQDKIKHEGINSQTVFFDHSAVPGGSTDSVTENFF